MNSDTHLIFNSTIGKRKPESIRNKATKCPFCDTTNLIDIIDQEGSIILLKNKFPVLKDTLQTVLIETDECQSDLSMYTKNHLYKLFEFGISKWMAYINEEKYKSVIYLRNFGPLSGGSLAHPHSQIVCFEKHDYSENINADDFIGLMIDQRNNVVFNLSTHPRVGFYEFNVILDDLVNLKTFADYTQLAAHYLLNNFIFSCDSYNVFYYYYDNKIIAKIVPRFATSPYYIGYAIPSVANNLEQVVAQFREIYF